MGNRVPAARGLPVIGSVFDMAQDMRAFLTESYLELGPVFFVRPWRPNSFPIIVRRSLGASPPFRLRSVDCRFSRRLLAVPPGFRVSDPV